jgi:chromate transport protein ChrA
MSGDEKAALRTLAILMTSLVVLPVLEVPFTGKEALPRMVMQMLVGAVILAALYNYIKKGSKTARVILTIIACIGVVLTATLVVVAIAVPALAVIYGVGMFARIAIIVLVNTQPINALSPELPAAKPRPIGETHQHDWQPHALLNDWLQCSICNEMHAEAGTVALVNRKD